MCNNIVSKNTEKYKNIGYRSNTTNELSKLLFQLYDESLQNTPEIAMKALDYIDLLLKKRIVIPDFINELDSL